MSLTQNLTDAAETAANGVLGVFQNRDPLQPFGRNSAINNHAQTIDRLRRYFNPTQSGRSDAVDGSPSLAAGRQSDFEYKVTIAFQKEVDQVRDVAERQLREIDLTIKRLPPEPEIDEASVLLKLDAEHESVLRSSQEPLVESKRAAMRAKRRLRDFREFNEPVKYRPVQFRNRTVAITGVLAVFGLEMVLNFIFLVSIGGRTPLEIFMLCFMTALINLMLSLLGIGFIGARNIGHVDTGRKFFGTVTLMLSAAGIVVLHLALANYRNALDIVRADPAALASAEVMLQRLATIPVSLGTTIRNDPFAFTGDLHAVVVFLMGMGFSLASACTGYWLLADPYPGYEAVDRICRDALGFWEYQRQCFDQAIEKAVASARLSVDAAVERGRQRLNHIKSSLDSAVYVSRRYEEVASEIEHAMLKLVDEYRVKYRLIRENAGPAHWQVEEPRLNREATFNLEHIARIEELELANFDALQQRAEQVMARLAMKQTGLMDRSRAYLELVDQDSQRDEDIALSELIGVRVPPPPDTPRGNGHAA